MSIYACTKRCRNCEKYENTNNYLCFIEECLVKELPKSKEELILENYIAQGFQWIYKYPLNNLKDKTKQTRIFYSEPWFSIEGGFTWVDLNSCDECACRNESKQAKFIELNIVDLKEPIKIEEYIKKYCD